MSKQFDAYREFDYQEDYEQLLWQREQEVNEQWELTELNNNKNYGYVTKKSNTLKSEDQIRA